MFGWIKRWVSPAQRYRYWYNEEQDCAWKTPVENAVVPIVSETIREIDEAEFNRIKAEQQELMERMLEARRQSGFM